MCAQRPVYYFTCTFLTSGNTKPCVKTVEIENIKSKDKMGKHKEKKHDKDTTFSQKKERVDENTIHYYKRVTETLNEGFPCDEDRGRFY